MQGQLTLPTENRQSARRPRSRWRRQPGRLVRPGARPRVPPAPPAPTGRAPLVGRCPDHDAEVQTDDQRQAGHPTGEEAAERAEQAAERGSVQRACRDNRGAGVGRAQVDGVGDETGRTDSPCRPGRFERRRPGPASRGASSGMVAWRRRAPRSCRSSNRQPRQPARCCSTSIQASASAPRRASPTSAAQAPDNRSGQTSPSGPDTLDGRRSGRGRSARSSRRDPGRAAGRSRRS